MKAPLRSMSLAKRKKHKKVQLTSSLLQVNEVVDPFNDNFENHIITDSMIEGENKNQQHFTGREDTQSGICLPALEASSGNSDKKQSSTLVGNKTFTKQDTTVISPGTNCHILDTLIDDSSELILPIIKLPKPRSNSQWPKQLGMDTSQEGSKLQSDADHEESLIQLLRSDANLSTSTLKDCTAVTKSSQNDSFAFQEELYNFILTDASVGSSSQ